MAQDIILEKFNQWTAQLPADKARIAVFEHIRDIPYYLVPQIADPEVWAASILAANKGSCSPKHYLLGMLFNRMGLEVKYVSYPFLWDKQSINYPPELAELAKGSPISYHGVCKAKIDGQWVLVDATWDSALKKAGFAVNLNWDGKSQTKNAVLPLEEVIHDGLQNRLDFVAQKRSLYTEKEKEIYAKFTEKFNLWLEGLRK